MVWTIVGACIILFIFILLITLFRRVYIIFHFAYEENNTSLTVTIKLAPFISIKRKLDFSKNYMNQINVHNFSEKGKGFLKVLQEMNASLSELLANVSVHHLDWRTEAGTGEAFTTGVTGGAIWTIKGAIIAYIAEQTHLHCRPLIHFEPRFNQQCFSTTVEGIVSLRIGKAIHMLRNKDTLLIQKEDYHGRTSNSRVNDNSDGKY